VILTKKNNVLMTSATEMNKHYMEIRGLGIIDIMSMFGVRAIRYQKRLEIVLELSLWDEESQDIERTGLNRETTSIMGVDIPLIRLPITPGKRSEEHTSELQSRFDLVCRLLLDKKNRFHVTLIRQLKMY